MISSFAFSGFTLPPYNTGIELAKCLVKEYLGVTFDVNSRSTPKIARITEYENA